MNDPSPSLTDKLVALTHSKLVLPVLLMLEIAETTFLPLPYEAAFIALCLAARERIWMFVAVTVLGSAIAGSILYALGAGLAEPLVRWFGIEAAVASYMANFEDRGGILIFLGGLTPVPSYLVNLVAGATGYSYLGFVALFSTSRFIRFAIIGALIYFFGDAMLRAWEKLHVWPKRIVVIVLLVVVLTWSLSALG